MRKWLSTVSVLLAVMLAAAVITCIVISREDYVPALSQGPVDTTDAPTTEQTETTEPAPTWMTLPADRALTAQQAFVYDCQEGAFSYLTGSADDRVYPASITKLFTAHVAMQYLQPQEQITAGDALELVGYGSSVAKIEEGDVFTVEKLIQAMLLPIGNDAAYLLAVETGRRLEADESISASYAVRVFLEEMNEQAKALGMTDTHFTNPDGYHDPDHYTTHHDMVILAKLAMENDTVMHYARVAQEEVTFTSGAVRQWKNTNALIDPASEYYCPYATGLKTGQTPSAGSCLLSSFDVEGRQWIVGVFGCPEIEDRFADTLQLFNEALEKE